MQETNFYYNSKTHLILWGDESFSNDIITIICFISYQHLYNNLVDLFKNHVLSLMLFFYYQQAKQLQLLPYHLTFVSFHITIVIIIIQQL